ncbi:hypothetical protein [Candidatus Nitrospira bockiana]
MSKQHFGPIIAFMMLLLALEPDGYGQTSGTFGMMSPALVAQIQQLAELLQQRMAEGKLDDAQIQTELQQGNLAAVIRELGPESTALLDQIKATLQSQHSEDELNAMLQGLLATVPSPGNPAGP